MIVTKYPSLETKWLHKYAPWMPQPKVIFTELKKASGLYYRPQHKVYLSNGVDLTNGLIIVDTELRSDVDSIIAHEWRHHYQHFHGPHGKGSSWHDLIAMYSYDVALVKYFTQSPTEMDAFLFGIENSKDEHDKNWLELLVKEREKNVSLSGFIPKWAYPMSEV